MALIVLAGLGLGFIITGVALVAPPAGLVVAGFVCVGVAYLLAEERQ